MKPAILLVAFLQLALAQRNIDGYEKLGPIPPTGLQYYYVSINSKIWADASVSCNFEGGQLVTLNTVQKDLALSLYMPGLDADVWVGAKSSGSGWDSYSWITNEPLTYTNWGGTCSPYSNGCVYVRSTLPTSWCATSCTTSRRYVCEI